MTIALRARRRRHRTGGRRSAASLPAIDDVEEVGPGLRDTARIFDDHAGRPQAGQREAHRHPVVVVGADRRGAKGPRRDPQPIVAGLDPGAEPRELGFERGHPVRLLDAQVRHVADRRRAVREERRDADGEHCVRECVHVGLDPAESPVGRPAQRDRVRPPLDRAAHRLEHPEHAEIGLLGVRGEPVDDDAAAADRRGDEGIDRSLRIRLDRVVAALVAHARADEERRAAVAPLDLGTECAHHVEGQVDEGARDEDVVDETQLDVSSGEGRGEQQPRHELARAPRIDRRAAARQAAAGDAQRRTAVLAEDLARRTERGQRVDELADRPLSHVPPAVDRHRAVGEAGDRGQEAGGGPGQAHVERRVRRPERAADALEGPGVARGLVVADRDAEAAQALAHRFGVVARRHADEPGAAVGEAGGDQRSVRDAPRAGRAEAGVDRAARADRQRGRQGGGGHRADDTNCPDGPGAPRMRVDTLPRLRDLPPARAVS